jgi:hypothetical protein
MGTCFFRQAVTQQRLLHICLSNGRCPLTALNGLNPSENINRWYANLQGMRVTPWVQK